MEKPVVFGMPGGHMIRVFDALRERRDRVDCVLVREEAIGSVMAEAHGRLTGRPAVVMGQGAWVLGNAGIGIMEAHLGSSPMVVLVDATEGGEFSHHGPYQDGMASYGGYELADALRAITKRTFLALDPHQAVQLTQLAVKHALDGEPGPVAVVFHSRALSEGFPTDAGGHPRLFDSEGYWKRSRPAPDLAEISAAADLIRAAERPVLVAGNGVRLAHAEDALAALIDETDIPAATTSGGKGTVDERSQLGLGVIGSFGHDVANRVVGDADLVIAVGTKLSPLDTADENPKLIDPERQTIVHLDVETLNTGWTTPADAIVIGDAADTLSDLRVALSGYRGGGTQRVRAQRSLGEQENESDFGGRSAVRVLSSLLPENCVVTCDAGENRLFVLHDYQAGRGGTVLQPNGGGGMGYAIPAAMAAGRLNDGRRAIAVCGDGGFSMTMHALMSAVENDIPLLVLVLDNRALGWVLHGQGDRPFLSEFRDFDLAAIATALGCQSQAVATEDELRSALTTALARTTGVSVVVARTSRTDRYQDVMSDLAGMDVEAVQGAN